MERFGRSKHYVLWRISYAELLVMNMDVSRYISAEELKERMIEEARSRKPEEYTTEYYQSKLGNL